MMKALNIKEMLLGKGKSAFFIKRSMKTTKPDFCAIFAKMPMKSTKPGFHQFPIVFSEYPSNRKICFVTTITHYSAITKDLRTTDQRIVSYMKPQKEVTTSTISTLCKVMLGKAGIDIQKYSSHLTRSASASKANIKGL